MLPTYSYIFTYQLYYLFFLSSMFFQAHSFLCAHNVYFCFASYVSSVSYVLSRRCKAIISPRAACITLATPVFLAGGAMSQACVTDALILRVHVFQKEWCLVVKAYCFKHLYRLYFVHMYFSHKRNLYIYTYI